MRRAMQPVETFFLSHWQPYAYTAARVLVVILGGLLLAALIKGAIRRMQARLIARAQENMDRVESSKRVDTLARLLEQTTTITIWALIAIIVLGQLGVAVGPLLAGAGIAGVALGFGAQTLVRDVISGFFLILENQIRVGDVAKVNGTAGLVERITLRTIVLRDLSGTVHVFPNGAVSTLSNMTSGWSAFIVDLGIAYHEDTDVVVDIMKQVGHELKADPAFGPLMIADIEVFGVDRFDDSAVVIKARLKTRPGKQMDVGREYNRRIKKALDARGIEIPFPQRTIHLVQSPGPAAEPKA
jgi:small-conductance mechanosensitive channel